MHIKTVILLKNFSFGLINFVDLSTKFFIQRFLRIFIFFIKTRFLTFFILGVNVFYIYALQRNDIIGYRCTSKLCRHKNTEAHTGRHIHIHEHMHEHNKQTFRPTKQAVTVCHRTAELS